MELSAFRQTGIQARGSPRRLQSLHRCLVKQVEQIAKSGGEAATVEAIRIFHQLLHILSLSREGSAQCMGGFCDTAGERSFSERKSTAWKSWLRAVAMKLKTLQADCCRFWNVFICSYLRFTGALL
jgi:hypothetical protein